MKIFSFFRIVEIFIIALFFINGCGGGGGNSSCTYGVIINDKDVCYDNENFPTQAQIDSVLSLKPSCPLIATTEAEVVTIPPNNEEDYIACIYHSDGYLQQQEEYRNGVADGVSLSLKSDGTMSAYQQYSKGEKAGLWLYLESDLFITSMMNYYSSEGQRYILSVNKSRDGSFSYHASKILSNGELVIFGSRVYIDTSDNVSTVHEYVEGHDLVKAMGFYVTGQLKSETPYDDKNQIQGVQMSYYISGNLEKETPFEKTKREGVEKVYYDNLDSTIKSETTYKNNLKHGNEKQYSPTGKLSSCRNFINGVDASDCMP